MIRVSVQDEEFNLEQEVNAIRKRDVGAIVTFTGVVRDIAGDLEALELEHYPAMTQAAIHAFCGTAAERWGLSGVTVIHRIGRLPVGADIMMVATASAHRRAAFEAADFLMDYLKSRAPFWKKEHRSTGAHWVAAREQDESDLARWTDAKS